MLQGRQPMIYGDGNQKRCFSFVSDDVAPLAQMAFDPACAGQILNIGPDDEFITIGELAATIARLLHFPLDPAFTRPRPSEVVLANCSADKARRMLGYRPRVKLEDGLRSMIDWIKSRGPRPFKYHLDLEIVNEKTPETWKQRLF
jgi:UDP-glucose 4-epimerase